MDSILAQNHMDIFLFGSFPLNQPKELEEFLMAMPRLIPAIIYSNKKTGRSVPLLIVVMDMPFHLPWSKCQHRLCLIQRLNLTLLVHHKQQYTLRGCEYNPTRSITLEKSSGYCHI